MGAEFEMLLQILGEPPLGARRMFSAIEAQDNHLLRLSLHGLVDQMLAKRAGAVPVRKGPTGEASKQYQKLASGIFAEIQRMRSAGLQPVEIQMPPDAMMATARNAMQGTVDHRADGSLTMFGVPLVERAGLNAPRVLGVLPPLQEGR